MDRRKLENNIYDIEIRDEINTSPMKSYIEEWFQLRIESLIQEGETRETRVHCPSTTATKTHRHFFIFIIIDSENICSYSASI
jgi:hypothetical protein